MIVEAKKELDEYDGEQSEESIEENEDLTINEKEWIKGNTYKLDNPFLMNKKPILILL